MSLYLVLLFLSNKRKFVATNVSLNIFDWIPNILIWKKCIYTYRIENPDLCILSWVYQINFKIHHIFTEYLSFGGATERNAQVPQSVSIIYCCITKHPKIQWFRTVTFYYSSWFCELDGFTLTAKFSWWIGWVLGSGTVAGLLHMASLPLLAWTRLLPKMAETFQEDKP